ncbi:MAG: hypothetical protein IJ184_04385 [Alphaproteobacteria bacterium]|nr:hypothetical protein [Alphaproteobacteria bacterium]
MPQLDFSVFPSQFFWLTICFFSLLFIMSKFIIPKAGEMIELRKAKIEGELAAAAELKKQVEEGMARYEQALREAFERADASLRKTKEELADTVSRKQSDLAARLSAEVSEGEKKIEAAKNRAMQKIEEAAADLTVSVLEKVGVSGVSKAVAQRAVDGLKRK